MITPLRDNYQLRTCWDILFHSYKKGFENFKLAFSKEELFEPKRNLGTRKCFFLAGFLYSIPLLSTITYIFINVVLKNTRSVLSYKAVIFEANVRFAQHHDKDKIIERIKKRLDECKYKESIENKRNPSIIAEKYDFYRGRILAAEKERMNEEEVNRAAILFIEKLPKMKLTLDHSYSEKV